MFHVQQVKSCVGVFLACAGAAYGAVDVRDKYPLCEDYYSRGGGLCAPQAPTVSTALVVAPSLLSSPVSAKSPVDAFLENYGKPPREFVAFYVSPTVENAKKWAAKYQEMVSKNSQLNALWAQAESRPAKALASVPAAAAPVSLAGAAGGSESLFDLKSSEPIGSLTSFSDKVDLTYYFSANCPYCAQMTPQLARLSAEMGGKLSLTCVDVTPLSPQYAPRPENMAGKLNCAWRLPQEGEVENRRVLQTPTLILKKGPKEEKTYSGFVPLEDLKAAMSN